MDDRELLEGAARAAQYTLTWADDRSMCWMNECYDGRQNTDDPWNPITDDGDALRLAVRLYLVVDVGVMSTSIDGLLDNQKSIAFERHGRDQYAATRRAIVRAAAVIGTQVEAQCVSQS